MLKAGDFVSIGRDGRVIKSDNEDVCIGLVVDVLDGDMVNVQLSGIVSSNTMSSGIVALSVQKEIKEGLKTDNNKTIIQRRLDAI